MVLSNEFATPLDILRKFDFADFRTGPQMNIDNPNLEILTGILQKGYFAKHGNMLHKLAERVRRPGGLKDKLIHYAPAIAGHLAAKIPFVKSHAAQIQ